MPAIPYIIMGGAQVVGNVIASKGQTKAAETANKGIEKGVELQREMYQQDRADLAPYRNLGGGAVGNLAYLAGIAPTAAPATTAPPTTMLSSLGAPHGTNPHNDPVVGHAMPRPGVQMVKVRSPSGQIGDVPAHLLPKALQAGGTQVS